MTRLLFLLFFLSHLTTFAQDYHVAAYYYPWYDKKHWKQGYVRKELTPEQPPLLGEYSSKDRKVVRQHLSWSEEYGIDSWICSWWGKRSKTDRNIIRAILPEIASSETQFAIFYESAKLLNMVNGAIDIQGQALEQLKKDIGYLSRTYFHHPSYLHIEGRPVLYIYLTRAFSGQVEEGINIIRQAAKEEGYDLFLVGDEVFWQRPNRQRIELLDAITPYNMHGPNNFDGYPSDTDFFEAVDRQYEKYQYVSQRSGACFIPNVFPGFNDKGVRPEANHYIIPNQVHPDSSHTSTLRTYLELAKEHIDPKVKLLTVTSFNEWHEDTQIEPTTIKPSQVKYQDYIYVQYGFDYLKMISELLK
jgi:glycoprotein endo-alpha-1,2-mannosidase